MGPGSAAVGARRLRGGVSSIVHDITVVGPSGDRRHVVLRRVPLDDEVPGHDPVAEVRGDAAALALLAGRALAPALLALDADGERCGVPSMLLERLPGRPVVEAARLPMVTEGLAAAVRVVRNAAVDPTGLPPFRPWLPAERTAPEWSRVSRRWESLHDELSSSRLPGGPDGLVHRDLHPGNVLFRRGLLSGIVDWSHAAVGPVEVDVSRCRVEVAILAGHDAADAFLAACRDLVPAYDRRWDALVAIELGPWAHALLEFNRLGAALTVDGIQRVCDDFVAAV